MNSKVQTDRLEDIGNMKKPQDAPSNVGTTKPEEGYKSVLTLLHDLALLHDLHVQFIEGRHEMHPQGKIFQIELRVGEFSGVGSGPTKQRAKLQAAQEVVKNLEKLPVPENVTPYWCKPRNDLVDPKERKNFFLNKHPVAALSEVLSVRRMKPPQYTFIDTDDRNGVPWYTVELRVGEQMVRAAAPYRKKNAKERAASRMLALMGFKEEMAEVQLEKKRLKSAFLHPATPAQAPRPVEQGLTMGTPSTAPDVTTEETEDLSSPEVVTETETTSQERLTLDPVGPADFSDDLTDSVVSCSAQSLCSEEIAVPEVTLTALQSASDPVSSLQPDPHEDNTSSSDLDQPDSEPVVPVTSLDSSSTEVQSVTWSVSTSQLDEGASSNCDLSDLLPPAEGVTEASTQPQSYTTPQERVAPQSSAAAHCLVTAMVKKLLRRSPVSLDTKEHVDLIHLLVEVESRVLDLDNPELNTNQLKTLGRGAAKSLLLEFGSTSVLLVKSEEEFIQAAVKHLQMRLRFSLMHPPKAKQGGFFSRMLRKAFRRNPVGPGPLHDYLTSGPSF